MKLVMQVKLLPTPEQAAALDATLHTCNALANRASAVAYEKRVLSRAGLQKLVYAELKASGLSAQPALHVIRKIADAYQRATLSTWPFHQLGTAIAYKAQRAGVPFLEVDPAYTSQTCPRCGHVARGNRVSRDHFCCRRCGLAGPADHIAAVNVRQRARTAWVFVSMPDPPPHREVGDATPARQPAATGSATKRERPSRKLGRFTAEKLTDVHHPRYSSSPRSKWPARPANLGGRRTSRPDGRVGERSPSRKVRAPQGRVVGNADPG